MLREGKRVGARLLDVRRLDSPQGHVRVAIVVPRYGFTVVRRNKLKRRLRELARHFLVHEGASCDILVRARPEAYDASFGQLREEIRHLGARIA